MNEQKPLKNSDKVTEGHQPGDKALKGETINTKEDNARQERQKMIDGMRSFKLTGEGQVPFQIQGKLGEKEVNVKDNRALRTDGSRITKNADNSSTETTFNLDGT